MAEQAAPRAHLSIETSGKKEKKNQAKTVRINFIRTQNQFYQKTVKGLTRIMKKVRQGRKPL